MKSEDRRKQVQKQSAGLYGDASPIDCRLWYDELCYQWNRCAELEKENGRLRAGMDKVREIHHNVKINSSSLIPRDELVAELARIIQLAAPRA